MRLHLFCLLATFFAPVHSFFVVKCYSRLFDERADPVVSPGVAAGHVHIITGGNGFNVTMDYNNARASQCSTCNVKQDLSNYWAPKMYFKAQNGSFIDVPIIGDDGVGDEGGMAVYYLFRPGPDNDPLTPFPPNFRMMAGDSSKRNETDDFAGRAVTHKCDGGAETKYLPSVKCNNIRVQVTFPACWDGNHTDSEDHKSHVVYPKDGNFDGGRCPSSHPVHLITLFYEVYYDTSAFKDLWYGDKQPFVFANGDGTGYGYHGDFVNGWDPAALQNGINVCSDGKDDCEERAFGTLREQDEAQACKLPSMIDEQVSGIMPALPGCNPVTYGPGPATPPASCNAPRLNLHASPQSLGYVDLTKSKGYAYVGCGKDVAGERTLNTALISGDDMTVEKCVDFCKGQNLAYAGVEYSGECYCGNSVAADRAPVTGLVGDCIMKCSGNSTEVCGGTGAISLYKACNGGTCSNAVKRQSRRLAALEVRNAAMLEASG